jgi:hypothetical protein
MKEEMKKILQMVEQNKITVEEAERLIEAITSDEETATPPQAQGSAGIQGKFLRVRVVEEGEQKVQVNVPLSIVEVGLKIGMQIGPQFAPELEGLRNINFGELMEAIRQGASGKLVEVKDEDTLVEVYVD